MKTPPFTETEDLSCAQVLVSFLKRIKKDLQKWHPKATTALKSITNTNLLDDLSLLRDASYLLSPNDLVLCYRNFVEDLKEFKDLEFPEFPQSLVQLDQAYRNAKVKL